MLLDRIEIPVGMEQAMPVLHAEGGDQHVDRLVDGGAPGAERTVIPGTGQDDPASDHGLENERVQRGAGVKIEKTRRAEEDSFPSPPSDGGGGE